MTGIPFSGKKIVCQRAAGYAGLVPFLHVCDEHGGELQLARTMAMWFSYCDSDEVREPAGSVMDQLTKNNWSRAHDECIRLVDAAIAEGLRACFLVDRVQFLDMFSISLLRECMHGRHQRLSRRRTAECSEEAESPDDRILHREGMICFMCVHVPLYNWKTAENLVDDITRSQKTFRIPIYELVEATREELRGMFRDLSDMEVEERWLDVYTESAGFCAGYFIERAAASRSLSGKLSAEGRRPLVETSKKLVLSIPSGLVRTSRLLSVMEVSADVAMRFHQIYDGLPPLFQTLTKILAIATRKCICKLPRFVMWEVLNDLIAEGVEANVLTIVLDEMVDMFLVKVDFENDEDVLSFRTPALADIALDVCTPVQVHAIGTALLGRLEPIMSMNFRIPLLMADLHNELGQYEEQKKLCWELSFSAFMEESRHWPQRKVDKWREFFDDEIQAAGYRASGILGDRFFVPPISVESIGNTLPMLRLYSAPVALGPIGHTLSIICRNTLHEWCAWQSASNEEMRKLILSTRTAADRYLEEVAIIENLLSDYGIRAEPSEWIKERDMMCLIANPAQNGRVVKVKAKKLLETFIPHFVESRLLRLYDLMLRLRNEETPYFIQNGPDALRKAYMHLRASEKSNGSTGRQAAAQNALMTLATMNWKPKLSPEFLPILHHQTVARLRSKTLTQLSGFEAMLFRHPETIDDLECFLVVTMRLYVGDSKEVEDRMNGKPRARR